MRKRMIRKRNSEGNNYERGTKKSKKSTKCTNGQQH